MDVPRVLSISFLLLFICTTASTIKNDRGEASFTNSPHFARRNRKIALNEYLVPPPPPRHHPLRSGRNVHPQPADSPGYFSKFINWLNPFNYGGSHPSPPKSPHPDAPFPPPPQGHGLPLDVHPPGPPNLPLHAGPQPPLPLYPPLGQPPNQHSGLQFGPPFAPHPVAPHPVAPLNRPPNPSLPIYGAPSTSHAARPYVLNNAPPNKGKSCNPCNKVPWIPMQGAGFHSDNQYLPPQAPNGYLPPGNQVVHDAQHAASHEIRIPDLPHRQPGQDGGVGLASAVPNPLLYPGPVPPLYQAGPFDQSSQNSHRDVVDHLEPPSLSISPSTNQGHPNSGVSGDHFNIHGNHDLTSSGTHIDQGHVSVPQDHGIGVSRDPEHGGSFGSSIIDQSPISGLSGQGYHDPSVLKEEHGVLSQSPQSNQKDVTSYESPNIENHGFVSQNGEAYESFASNTGHGLNYLPPNLGPSGSFGASASNNRDIESLNYQYSDDLSPSSSVIKDSRAITETTTSSSSGKGDSIHFEQSPLLDLTKKSESDANGHGTVLTEGLASTVKTTIINDLGTDNTFFKDSSNSIRPTESYSSNVQSVDGSFGHSTPPDVELSGSNDNRYTETSTVTQYTNQQDVSYIPPSGQPGFLWPSLLLNNPTSENESSSDAFLDPLARWSNSSKEAANYRQGRPDSTDAGDTAQRQQNFKRNKQVQVIIPYTSEYTPIPFQQSHGDWSAKNNAERTQARKVPSSSDKNIDNYLQQESRNEIRLISPLQPQFALNDSKKLNIQSVNPLLRTKDNDLRSTTVKANSSIDVRRLQKNIDNWTIQEYSKPTPSSTILPSSPHPYLQPSKKIPTEYLTTTGPSDHVNDHANESNDNVESVKTYSLAGFSFNGVDHEGSASNHIEATQTPIHVIRIESSKSASPSGDANKLKETSTWEQHSVSISTVDKERVYVVTPQPTLATSPKNDFEKQKRKKEKNGQEDEKKFSQFEAIEKAYQVLPQAVNNLAVASTGKEDIPLWGIMEHEEFATLNSEETDDEANEDVVGGPILYAGHSKVSRAKR